MKKEEQNTEIEKMKKQTDPLIEAIRKFLGVTE